MNLRNDAISHKQQQLWLVTALAVPLLHTASGASWVAVLPISLLCLAICLGMEALAANWTMPEWMRWLQWCWVILTASQMLGWSAACWNETDNGFWIELVLTALAVWTACRGMTTAARTAGVLRYFLLAIAGAILLSAVKEIKPRNLLPEWRLSRGSLITVLLIPALFSQKEEIRIQEKIWLGAIGLAASVISVGVLSGARADEVIVPFYELSRSLTFFGVVKRFESLAAAALTMGYFVVLTLLFSYNPRKENRIIVAAGILALALSVFAGELDSRMLAVGAMLLWVLLPAIGAVINKLKKYEKST